VAAAVDEPVVVGGVNGGLDLLQERVRLMLHGAGQGDDVTRRLFNQFGGVQEQPRLDYHLPPIANSQNV